MKKSIVMFFFIIALIIMGTGNVSAKTVTLGYVEFPPYEFQNSGQPDGILVDIVSTIFQRSNIKLQLKFMPFKKAFVMAQKGKIDGLFNLYKTEERLNLFDYSESIIQNNLVFFVKKESSLDFQSLESLKGLKIGVILGYTYGDKFDKSLLHKKEDAYNHDENFIRLMKDRIDAYPVDKLVGIHIAKQKNIMPELKILPQPLKKMDGYIGFTKGRQLDVIKEINKIINEMKQNGEIASLITKYIDKS